MLRYEDPKIETEMFLTENIVTDSGTAAATAQPKIAVPQGQEGTLLLMGN